MDILKNQSKPKLTQEQDLGNREIKQDGEISDKIPNLQAFEIYNMFLSRLTHSLDIFIRKQREKRNWQDDPIQAELDKLRNEAVNKHETLETVSEI